MVKIQWLKIRLGIYKEESENEHIESYRYVIFNQFY